MTNKKPKRVFIVEDNTIYAKTLQKHLENTLPAGSVIDIFQVGELAIDKLHLNPDFIIMDYMLNSKFHDAADGLAMIDEVRKVNKTVKIIVLSAQEKLEIAVKAMEQSGGQYIIKNDEAFKKVEEYILSV